MGLNDLHTSFDHDHQVIIDVINFSTLGMGQYKTVNMEFMYIFYSSFRSVFVKNWS
jgi:hypothetical protein